MTRTYEENLATSALHVEESSWPLLRADRNWTQLQLVYVLTVTACATWCYIIGEYVGYYLNLKMGVAAMIAGGMIGMLIVTLAVVPIATKFGIESVATTVPQYGTRGWILTIIPQFASILGWNAILLIFFGMNVAKILALVGASDTASAFAVPAITVLSSIICYLVLLKGATGLEKVSTWLFFFIVLVGAWMIYLLVTKQAGAIAAAKPAYASESLQWNYAVGVEIALASNLSWWAYAGAMVRQARNAGTAALPSMLGMGLPVPLLSIIGLASVLALQVSDPSAWMVELGGPFYGAIALIFVAAANFGTFLAGVYASSVGLRQVPALKNVDWRILLAIGILPVLLMGLFIPDLVFAKFGTFLAFIGLAFGPICGIQIADYYILRRGRVSVRAIYDRSETSAYYYWGGFNIAAVVAMAAGCSTYLYLLNPLTYASASPFEFTTASLPAVVVSAVVYVVVTWVVVKPARKGGYGA